MITHNNRRKVKVCYERLGLVLLGCLATVLFLSGYPSQTQEARELQQLPQKNFDINRDGVVVVLDIAKTGMNTLTDYMIRHASLYPACRCKEHKTKCQCLNRLGYHWLFHAPNTTGPVCGENADFTALINCPIDYWFRTSGRDNRTSRKYLPITMLRDPLSRYLSQWLALTQEDTFFKNEPRLFRSVNLDLQKKGTSCYQGKKLANVSLQDFFACSENKAANLQVKMLANMSWVRNLGLTGRNLNEALLESAKSTLQMFPFFGLFSRPNDTQKLLEKTLGFKFRQPLSFDDQSVLKVMPIPAPLHHQILQVNNLDLRLYQFAKELFKERVRAVRFPQGTPGSSSVDTFQIIYRPDLGQYDETQPLAETTGNKDLISGNRLRFLERGVRKDDVYISNDEENVILQTEHGPVMKVYSADNMKENDEYSQRDEDDDIKFADTKYKEDVGQPESEGVNIPDIKYRDRRQSVDSRPNINMQADEDNQSTDYTEDLEDVDLFLNRLERVKQQQKQDNQKQSQQLQQKILIQPQKKLPALKSQLMFQKKVTQKHQPVQGAKKPSPYYPLRSFGQKDGGAPKDRPAISSRDMKPHQFFILDDTDSNMVKSNSEKNVHRMLH